MLRKLQKKNHWRMHLNSKEGTIQLKDTAAVKGVKYVSFEEISSLIKEKYIDYYNELEKNHFQPNSAIKEIIRKKSIIEDHGVLLKDNAYQHEKEIRAFFSICLRNEVTEQNLRKLQTENDTSALFGTATFHHPDPSILPKIIKIPTNNEFIESICFDPRMPSYQKDVLLKILSPYIKNIKIEESYAFGYKPDKDNFSVKH